MKPARLHALADLAVNIYNRKRDLHVIGDAGDFIMPNIDRVPFKFIGTDARAISMALDFYVDILKADIDAPPKLVELSARLAANFLVLDGDYSLWDFILDTNEMHVIVKACGLWLDEKTHRDHHDRASIRAVNDLLGEGKRT